MTKRQTDAPAFRRNINRWLADNCFGDYYTRKGLNDQKREMIIFAFFSHRATVKTGSENILPGRLA